MNDHTQTPWRVFTNKDGTKLVGIGSQEGEGILDCGFGVWSWNDPEGIANANLVVKAVNSHEALVKALEGIAEFCSADATKLGAIERLTAIRNTALNVLGHVGSPKP
jgi:hypothetical protein